MQELKEKGKKEMKFDCYMPIDSPNTNKAYQLLKGFERTILKMVAFTIPDEDTRPVMDAIRNDLKEDVCGDCKHLNQFTQSKKIVQVFVKDDDLSEEYGIPIETEKEPIKVVKVLTEQEVDRSVMSCLGCRGLKIKQIATGYIKGRRFKQV